MNILIFLFGGWNSLSRLYPDRPFEAERTWAESSMYLGHSLFGSYRRCVDVAINSQGLRLSVPGISKTPLLPPIVFGWKDVEKCARTRFGLFGEGIKFRLRDWPNPIYVGRFLWKYGDAYEEIIERWGSSQLQLGAQ